MFELAGKVAIVTGARRGMGRAHAVALAHQGAKVVITDIDADECARVADEIRAQGGEASSYRMDVSNKAEIDSVFDAVVAQYGTVDILINNAGIFAAKPAFEIAEDEWNTMIDINLRGQFFCAQRAAKEMAKRAWGRIINVASIASGGVGIGIAGGAHYTASKGAIIGMTETLAVEWAPLGITVNVIAPGAIDTPMVSSTGMPSGALDGLLATIPLRRMGTSEEVAAMAVFLASDESRYITGATFYVDGGWLAG